MCSSPLPIHHRGNRHDSFPRLGCGSPATRLGSVMILHSRLLSAFTRRRCASVSAPDFATTGALRAGLACGAAGAAGGGAVRALGVGGIKTSVLNEYPPGGAAR